MKDMKKMKKFKNSFNKIGSGGLITVIHKNSTISTMWTRPFLQQDSFELSLSFLDFWLGGILKI